MEHIDPVSYPLDLLGRTKGRRGFNVCDDFNSYRPEALQDHGGDKTGTPTDYQPVVWK